MTTITSKIKNHKMILASVTLGVLVAGLFGGVITQNIGFDEISVQETPSLLIGANPNYEISKQNGIKNIPFEITMSENEDENVFNVQKGQTAKINVDIIQNVPNTIGKIDVYPALMPECATPFAPAECDDIKIKPISSKKSISQSDSITLIAHIPKDMESGIYQYNISVGADVKSSESDKIIDAGYITAFSIEVE